MKKYKRNTKTGTYYDKDDFELDLVIELDERHYETVQDIDTVCEKLNRLVELEDKLENGTLIELPCKVGDIVYRVGKTINVKDQKYDFYVQEYEITKAELYKEEILFVDDSDNEIFLVDLGKTLFLTKAEAEARLKELENERK